MANEQRITFEGLFCDIAQCIGEPGNTSECESGFCDQRRTWERLKEYEDKLESGNIVEVVRCKDCVYYEPNSWLIPRCKCFQGLTEPRDNCYCSHGERRTE